jgi:hypothetical protein
MVVTSCIVFLQILHIKQAIRTSFFTTAVSKSTIFFLNGFAAASRTPRTAANDLLSSIDRVDIAVIDSFLLEARALPAFIFQNLEFLR